MRSMLKRLQTLEKHTKRCRRVIARFARPLSAKSGHRQSLLIAPDRQVTNGLAQGGKDLDAVSRKTP